MLVNSMIYGRFRYYVNVEPMPQRITEALISDAQALLWNKSSQFQPGELGTTLSSKRWMKGNAQYLPRKGSLGGGVLHWPSHVKALMVHRLLKYRDASRGPWKEILDNWFDREESGRGAIFASHRIKDLIQSTATSSAGESKLPRLWKLALQALQELQLTPRHPQEWSWEGARAIPVWFNPVFTLPNIKREEIWRRTLRLNSVKDLMKDDGSQYTDIELEKEIERLAHVEGEYVRIKRGEWVHIKKLIDEWHKILSRVPVYLLDVAKGDSWLPGYSKVAQQMLRNLGWKPGDGIGRKGEGISEPIPSTIGQTNKRGLGSNGKPKTKSKKKADPYIAIWSPGGVKYGTREGQYLRVHELNVKGVPTPTGEVQLIVEDDVRKVLRWGKGIVGIAESSFPEPREWRLGTNDTDLDKLAVRDLTTVFTRSITSQPSCIKAWQTILGDLDFLGISNRYSTGIMTPKDYGSHYKLFLHRSFFTNPHNPKADTDLCRLCGVERETIEHFGNCMCLRPMFETMRKFDKGERWDDTALNLFGHYSNKKIISHGTSLIHFVLWKMTIIQMTQLSIEGTPFSMDTVIERAKGRIRRKIETAKYNINVISQRASARQTIPRAPQFVKWLAGIGEVEVLDDTLKIFLSQELIDWLYK